MFATWKAQLPFHNFVYLIAFKIQRGLKSCLCRLFFQLDSNRLNLDSPLLKTFSLNNVDLFLYILVEERIGATLFFFFFLYHRLHYTPNTVGCL